MDEGGYRTEFEITQRNHTNVLSLVREQVAGKPPPDEPKRFYGVKVGEVVNNLDPLNRGRVQVRLPDLDEVPLSAWAPCVAPLAGAAGSIYFPIQVGDQVLVVFQDGNLDAPYVIGCLWNMQTQPPAAAGSAQFTIRHPSGSEIAMLADGSVRVSAVGDLKLEAKNKLELKAPTIAIEATADVAINANNVNVKVGGLMNVTG
jgi:uncharacterized protein involved in type VI secretion and phage assembly